MSRTAPPRRRCATVPARPTSRADAPSDRRQVVSHTAHAVVLAKLTALDGALVVAILPPAARVESPRLNRRGRARRNVHVAPRGRDPQALECARASLGRAPGGQRHRRTRIRFRAVPRRGSTSRPCGAARRQVQVQLLTFQTHVPVACGRVTRPSLPDAASSMPYSLLELSVAERVATITVNRPDKLNA